MHVRRSLRTRIRAKRRPFARPSGRPDALVVGPLRITEPRNLAPSSSTSLAHFILLFCVPTPDSLLLFISASTLEAIRRSSPPPPPPSTHTSARAHAPTPARHLVTSYPPTRHHHHHRRPPHAFSPASFKAMYSCFQNGISAVSLTSSRRRPREGNGN
jgi:hypothetical protein